MAAPFANLPAPLADLGELTLDLRWSWSHAADVLWQRIDPGLWAATRNPWLILQNAPHRRLEALAADPDYVAELARLAAARRARLAGPSWFQGAYPAGRLGRVAYFSMEFGLSQALPIYSGGLGILAGDYLKSASDLGVPMVGIGLLWQQGYFRQSLDEHGGQQEFFPYNDPAQLPLEPVLDADGDRLRIAMPLPGRAVVLRVWRARVERNDLYLLDSNDPLNSPADRGITAELYGGGPDMRLLQELCLGLGGWQLLERLAIEPAVCHLNEGHAAFVVLARAGACMRRHGGDFRTALDATRAGNVFTTHTPVEAGFDRFEPALLLRQTEPLRLALGLTGNELLGLGRARPDDPGEPFNMAYLALHGSLQANAVSRLHGQVSRAIFQPLFPRWPTEEVPVGHVTNGVHVPSWDSAEADRLWTEACGSGRWLDGDLARHGERIGSLCDGALWDLRVHARQTLIAFARERLQAQLAAVGAPAEQRAQAARALDPNTLTLGFARRFAAYKRGDMLLADPDRLLRLLGDPRRPVQIILAGKAHPGDDTGKAMIRRWNAFIAGHPEIAGRLVFIADYDMLVAEQLVQGVDLWLNTPRRPWEACGTSGMKVLVNGGLNLSELDGWWQEAYAPELGWALGDGLSHDAGQDPAEADALYRLLEEEVVPLFYGNRDGTGCPCGWVAKMRASMSVLAPRFSGVRMLREYLEGYYLPAAEAYAGRDAAFLARLAAWRASIGEHWERVHFGEWQVEETADAWLVRVPVYLDDLAAEAVAVELYAAARGDAAGERHAMARGEALSGAVNGYAYQARLAKARPIADYTPRVVPALAGARVPLEMANILWYR